ncbi:ATP-binding cassette domain-containing protein [Mariniblastus sp.]|nr:ATP-binding cassette domain-containing protein [Mariniblastus sp.]
MAPPLQEILVHDSPVQIGRSRGANARLLHPTVSRTHAEIRRRDNGFVIEDLNSHYGTLVNGVRVRMAQVELGDRVQFGTFVTYRVGNEGLLLTKDAHGLELETHGVAIIKGGKKLLGDINLLLPSDKFVGILGPSGGGKSTLLNCLASHREPSSGRLTFNGQQEVSELRDEYRMMLGHVPQEEIVFLPLTSRENLLFSGRLRFGSDKEPDTLDQLVATTLQRVGLEQHADKPVSVLSGGQRKRLSVAIEILSNPQLLLLDEPTSGLDPASGSQLMEQLRIVASRGTTVVCTTHLMDNLNLLDIVVVLGKINDVGRLAYVGPPQDLLQYFDCHSYADLYEILETGQFEPFSAGKEQDGDSEERSSYLKFATATEIQSASDRGGIPDFSGGPTRELLKHLVIQAMDDDSISQAKTMFFRELLLISRDKMLVLMMIAQPLVLGLIVCLTQFNMDYPTPLYFFSSVLSVWLGLNNSARDLVRQRKLYVRDRLAGLRPGAYLAAKFTVFGAVGIAQVFFLLLILRLGSWFVLGDKAHCDLTAISSILWLMVMVLSYLGGLGIGFITSSLVRSEEAAVAALPLLIIPQLLLSVVALGESNNPYDQARPLRPLIVTLQSPSTATGSDYKLSGYAQFVDLLSMPLFTRPATLSLDGTPGRIPEGYIHSIWLGDFLHLGILVCFTWIGTYLTFLKAESGWPRLIGY